MNEVKRLAVLMLTLTIFFSGMLLIWAQSTLNGELVMPVAAVFALCVLFIVLHALQRFLPENVSAEEMRLVRSDYRHKLRCCETQHDHMGGLVD